MGIVKDVKNKVTKTVKKGNDTITNTLNSAADLSDKQIDKIALKREAYLSDKPDPNSEESNETIHRQLGAVGIEVFNAYLPEISNLYTALEDNDKFDGNNRIAYFEITKWVQDPDENNLEKLINVYQVLGQEDCNVALIYQRKEKECHIYLAVVNNGEESDISEVDAYKERLYNALKGNFPGSQLVTEVEGIYSFGINAPECIRENHDTDAINSIAAVTNVATEKTEKYLIQTIENILDGVVPDKEGEEYTMVLLATPVQEAINRKNRIYELYTALAPYATWQTNYTVTEGDTLANSTNGGLNVGGNIGSSHTEGIQKAGVEEIGKLAGAAVGTLVGTYIAPGIGTKVGMQLGSSLGGTIGGVVCQGKSVSDTTSKGASIGANFAKTVNVSVNLSKNEGITQNFTNYGIQHTLEVLEKQVERLEESSALGLWDFSAYVLSKDSNIANNVAHTYLAMTQGEESFVCDGSVNLWRGDLPDYLDKKEEALQAQSIMKSLSRLQHPEFVLTNLDENEDDSYLMFPTYVNTTVSVSGKELARSLSFPRKSVAGVPVIDTVSFGRNISSFDSLQEDVSLGNVYHMHKVDSKNKVKLSKKNLAAHTFITGSTGAGKSNTVYTLLNKLNDGVKFMVIEPAKGEYKDVFGGRDDVTVYGTNPYKYNELLQINPFSFPNEIHILEHVDRLVEIFNACWPMYAAMPAILKESIERSYEECGWNLKTSRGRGVFPTFDTLLDVLPRVIDDSSYSSDTSSDYKGALVTRVRSLTRGIHGQIFEGDIDTNKLFNENAIVDISRIGSAETKSLVMGILVLKLQEFRMSEDVSNNSGLRHVTVLEEAHNLLKKTSSEQSQEGSNVQGKSVEMIANAIAEMRTYGEGFIIADQSPGLMDMSVIRNTNTKIIMRLPDESDRELVGRAVGLTDEQIVEISRLETGVAVTYQSGWLEPVLCKVDYFADIQSYVYKEQDVIDHEEISICKLLNNVYLNKGIELDLNDVEHLNKWMRKLNLTDRKKLALQYAIQGRELTDINKMSILLSLSRINDFSNRPEVIRKTKDVMKSFGMGDNQLLLQTIEKLIIENITAEGQKVERNIR